MRRSRLILLLVVALLAATSVAGTQAGASGKLQEYEVTIENLTTGQPMSPAVLATFRGTAHRAFKVGHRASNEVEAIAENGDQTLQFDRWSKNRHVTDVVDVGAPLVPSGSSAEGFSSTVTVNISAHPGDRLGLVTMLICTNDGITGLSAVKLPASGSAVHLASAYDAGTEENTEVSEDLVDPCSGIGPVGLPGDPDGNRNDEIDTNRRISHHPGIGGSGELTSADHGWTDPVMRITITRVDDDADEFEAPLSGSAEVPIVATAASGKSSFELAAHDVLRYELDVDDISGVTQAHIHYGSPAENGPVVAFLFGLTDPTGEVNGELVDGAVVPGHLTGPLAGDWAGFVEALQHGDLYVNVHTAAFPSGELRGQIGTS